MFLVRYDSAKFYLTMGQQEKALKAVHIMYKTGGSDVLAECILAEI